MKCHSCGAEMRPQVTDLPFKLHDNAIVILKGLPVMQCMNCREYLIQDDVMEKVENILSKVNVSSELEVVRFAA